jgi:RNA polymerase sigma-70 factor (ECF subfamily)
MADLAVLMARYCDGDASAFRQLYGLVAPRVFGYLVKMARERVIATDLLQITFMKLHLARGAYIRGADPAPWIFSIAHRSFVDHLRRRTHERAYLGRAADAGEPHADLSGVTDERREVSADPVLQEVALAALAELPVTLREAVVLTKLEGKTMAEAASIAGTTVAAMKVRAHRGYKALRVALGERPFAIKAGSP